MTLPRSLAAAMLVVSGSMLVACNPLEPAIQGEGEPLSAFTDFQLKATVGLFLQDDVDIDPANYKVSLLLRPVDPGDDPPAKCRAPAKVSATVNDKKMTLDSDPASCDYATFTLATPRTSFTAAGGNARFVLTDGTTTMTAEFEDFYGSPAATAANPLPVLACEGVAACVGSGPTKEN